MLKQVKTVGQSRIHHDTVITLNTGTVCFDATVDGSRDRYMVCRTVGESVKFDVLKTDDAGITAKYSTDTFHMTCTCKGFRKGYLCRHLRMVDALTAKGLV